MSQVSGKKHNILFSAWKPPVSCDFEDPELCGWSHHDKDDQDWIWNTGKTTTSRTGPSYDHTLGAGGDGKVT
jgi:hypothetical protein